MQDIWTNHSKHPKENPFDVPAGYFDMLEDRIEGRIRATEKEQNTGKKIIRLLKPMLGLAASFALIFLLVHYPLSRFLPWYMANHSTEQTNEEKPEEEFLANTSDLDESSFFRALTTQDNATNFESEEIISLLSSELNDYDVYAEIIN